MKRTLWRLRLLFWLRWYGYCALDAPIYSWKWSGDECWETYRIDGYSPREAVLEDLSYG